MTWNTDSIDTMEATAKGEEDRTCSVKIRDNWLEVKFVTETVVHHFEYKWGKNFVARDVAARVLASKESKQ
jgi:hypothetical protein